VFEPAHRDVSKTINDAEDQEERGELRGNKGPAKRGAAHTHTHTHKHTHTHTSVGNTQGQRAKLPLEI